MHPPLASQQQIACKDLIQALQECHRSGLLHRYTGGCNDIKNEMNLCLRRERLARRQHNHEEAKARRAKAEAVWKAIDEES